MRGRFSVLARPAILHRFEKDAGGFVPELPSVAAEGAAPPSAQTATLSPWLFLALQAAVFMVSAEARVVAPLLPAVASDFGTTVAAAGLLITSYAIPYGLFQLIYGPLADRFSRQRVMGVALSLFALGTFAGGWSPSFGALNVLRLCTGAAAAGVIPVALAYVGDAFPYQQRQAALGRVVSVAALGGVLSAALGGIVASLATWRALFIGYGLLALVVGAVLLRLPVQRVAPHGRARRGVLTPYRDVFRHAGRRAAVLYGLVFFEGMVATSTLGYIGGLLFERDHMPYATIGVLLMLYGVGSTLAARMVGWLVVRLRERGMLFVGGMLLALAYLLMSLQPALLFFPVAVLIAGGGYVIAHSTLQTRATELVPSQRGTAVALFAFCLFLGGGIGTYLAGQVIDYSGYTIALYLTAALLAMFGVVAWRTLDIGQKGGG
jgi:predicted MFS family arabinose efflux permease